MCFMCWILLYHSLSSLFFVVFFSSSCFFFCSEYIYLSVVHVDLVYISVEHCREF